MEGRKEEGSLITDRMICIVHNLHKEYIAEYSIRKSPVPTHSIRACFHRLTPF